MKTNPTLLAIVINSECVVLTHLADHIFKRIFANENVRISIRISLKFVPKGPVDSKRIGSGNGLAPKRRQAYLN